MDIQNLLKIALVENDKARDRSQQTELGASSVGGCRRQAWQIIHQKPKTNFQTESLAAIIGTALHATIAESMKNIDSFGDDFLIEEGFSTPDLKGHIDLYIKSTKTIVDWKTSTKKKLAAFPSPQQIMQVNLYGYLLVANGYEVDNVSLVCIPRDGVMADVKVWQQPYNPEIAQEGLAWIRDLQETLTPPEPEKHRRFCESFCEYYNRNAGLEETGCSGIM